MLILGIGGWLHDGAAAVLRDGEIVAAIEEEKLRRQAHAPGMPSQAVETCLRIAGAGHSDVDIVALSRPFGQRTETAFHLHLKQLFPKARLVVVDHHDSHAASAFFASPHEKARVVTMDRRGDMRCGAVFEGDGNELRAVRDSYAPDTPAALYSRVAELIGFRADYEEHKVQWLSLQGEPAYEALFEKILGISDGDRINLDYSYFDTSRATDGGFSEKFYREAGLKASEVLDEKTRQNLAASIQSAIEKAVAAVAGEGKALCLAGGLAMNALLVAALESSGRFETVWVQPAAGNAGTAIGGALFTWHRVLGQTERRAQQNLFLGPNFDSEAIKRILENCKLRFRLLVTDGEIVRTAVSYLADNKIVSWFQGRTEFGPRALGNRSILASPLNPYSTINLNQYIKRREPFRKFAAAVPEEQAAEYFEPGENAWSLATISRVKKEHRKTFEAALLDGERLRLQTVRRKDSPLFWELLQEAGRQSGLPVLYNTSFNLFGEPLVSDPRAAVRSFYASGIDAMFVGGFLLEK